MRCAVRRERSLPLLAEFRAWLNAACADALPKSLIGQAATYARNQWQALTRYCEDGELSFDNNAAERAMKIPALGRNAWLFVASRAGGGRAANLFSLVAICKADQVEPWAYVLARRFSRLPALASVSTEELDPLLPDRWLLDHPPAPLGYRRPPTNVASPIGAAA
jgi:transposase